MGNFNVKTTGRAAVPRSKRLREAGGYSSSGTVINAGNTSPSSGSGDGHKAALDAISIDNAFYLWLLQKLDGEDDSTRQKVKAGYADDAAHAAEADHALDADTWEGHQFDQYLNQAVRTTDIVQFAKVIAGLFRTPDFVSGIETGSGAAIDERGNGEMNGLTLRSFLKVPMLIYNKIRVTGGEMWNTEGATIAEVTQDPGSETAFTLLLDGAGSG